MGTKLFPSKRPRGHKLGVAARPLSREEIEGIRAFHVERGQGIPVMQAYTQYLRHLAGAKDAGWHAGLLPLPTYSQYCYRVRALGTALAKRNEH